MVNQLKFSYADIYANKYTWVHWVAAMVNIIVKTITIYDLALMSFTDDEILASVHPLCALMPRFLMYCPNFYVNRRYLNKSFDLYKFVYSQFGVLQHRYGWGDCRPYVLKVIKYLIFGMPFNFTCEHKGLICRKIMVDIWMAHTQ